MKRPDSFLTNTITATGRAEGAAKNNPGDNTGSGMDKEIYNDPAYAAIAVAKSWKEGGISNSDETTEASDLRDAIEEMTGKKVTDPVTPANSVEEWDVSASYTTIGEHVMRFGMQYVAYYVTGITGVDPASEAGILYWKKVPTIDKLMDSWNTGNPLETGFHFMSYRNGIGYQQNIKFGRYRLGRNGEAFKQFSFVHLDGTIVTGNATLEAMFGIGGTEYWNIDVVAPDVLGTRTLISLGERTHRYQSIGGQSDTVGELQADAMQRITGSVQFSKTAAVNPTGVFSSATIGSLSPVAGPDTNSNVGFNSAASTSPIPAKTNDFETRMKNYVKCIPGVILCNDL